MPFVRGFLRIVNRRDRFGRPVDPDYGLEVGEGGDGAPDQGFNPDYPDQGLPGEGGAPGQGLPGYPGRPGQGLPPSYPGRPGHGLPHPGRPIDPGFGWEGLPPGIWGGGMPGQLPVLPIGPDQGLPPMWGHPLPPVDPPPGSIWPPIGPGNGLPPQFPAGKAVVIAGIPGVGWRYIVVTIPPAAPGQGLPAPTPEPKD
jgi:hypothetical protein